MINRLQIRNFRCFDTLNLQGLRRFNLIVGESGSGKTAFLETLFLLSSGNPEGYFRLRRWRGFGEGQVQFSINRDSFESIFLPLFHRNDKSSSARISFTDNREGKRSLDIYFERQQMLSISLNNDESLVRITPITFRWEVDSATTSITLEIEDGKIKGKGSAEIFPLHYISPRNTSSRFDAQMFSELSRSLKLLEVQQVIAEIFGYIEDLSLEIIAGETLIHARVKGFKEKVPVNELSGGLNRYISIALAIASNPHGVVCIDEIEGGFYYKNHRDIMKSLVRLCNHYSVQMFASTHSWEFLEAVSDAMQDRPDDLALLKAKYENNTCIIRKVDGKGSISAIDQDIEIRN